MNSHRRSETLPTTRESSAPGGSPIKTARRLVAGLILLTLVGCGRTPPNFVPRPPIKGHSREVTSIAFGPNGQTLASRSADAVKLWDVAKATETQSFGSDGSDFGTVAFSPDGTRLATEEIGRGLIVREISGDREPVRFAFPPGKKVEPTIPTTRGWGLAYSPDGKFLAGGGSHEGDAGFLALWQTADRSSSELGPLKRPITTVAFAPDGRTIASGSMDGKIVLYDVASRKLRITIEANRSYLAQVAFSPDGRVIASANEARWVKLWDSATGQDGGTYKGHLKAVLSVAFHPNGQTLVSGDSGGTIFVWDIPSRKVMTRLEPKDHGKVWSLAFSPDGKILASGGEDRMIHLWDVSGDLPTR